MQISDTGSRVPPAGTDLRPRAGGGLQALFRSDRRGSDEFTGHQQQRSPIVSDPRFGPGRFATLAPSSSSSSPAAPRRQQLLIDSALFPSYFVLCCVYIIFFAFFSTTGSIPVTCRLFCALPNRIPHAQVQIGTFFVFAIDGTSIL